VTSDKAGFLQFQGVLLTDKIFAQLSLHATLRTRRTQYITADGFVYIVTAKYLIDGIGDRYADKVRESSL
jgi:hypothetical protein